METPFRESRSSGLRCLAFSHVSAARRFGDAGDDQLHGDNFIESADPAFDSGNGNDTCDGTAGIDTAALCETVTRCRNPRSFHAKPLAAGPGRVPAEAVDISLTG
jgi:hypothetical protein